jgi:hypothetical protein
MRPWRKKRDTGLMVFEIHSSSLARNTVYDSMIGNPSEIAVLVGLSPLSDDVDEMERKASAERLIRLSGLTPVLAFQASLIAQAAVKFQARATEQDDDEALDLIEQAYSAVAFSAAVATLSNLLDLDIIHLAGD